MKTKKEVVQDLIEQNQENIWRNEIVRDFNSGSDVAEAKVQVDAANANIKKSEVQIAWLQKHLESLA